MTTKQVVTAIETLSPVNKRNGEGRITYLKKRQNILGSLTNLVEIDLLQSWEPMTVLNNSIKSDYLVLVTRRLAVYLPNFMLLIFAIFCLYFCFPCAKKM
jgi:hypothetical protein